MNDSAITNSFNSICVLLGGTRTIDSTKIKANEKSILCENTDKNPKCEYYFDSVVNGKKAFLNDYKKTYSPLVEQVINGKSVSIVSNSVPSNVNPFIISNDKNCSLLTSITEQILNSSQFESLTFSWFKISCDENAPGCCGVA